MKKIWQIFKDDLLRLKGNIVGIVIICGLILLPSLYAWFSLLAFWNPEGSTGNVDVAVANCDEGYQSDLLSSRIDAGIKVVDDLRNNEKFHWVFVDEDEAIEGVKSGKYYAALVIPQDFSKDLVSVFSGTMENPSIQYYVNEKINPVAPHLTSIGASTIQNDIDQAFSSTVANTALGINSDLAHFLNGEGITSYVHTLVVRLGSASDEMKMDASQIRAFSALLEQSQTLIETSSAALERTGTITSRVQPLVESTKNGLDEAMQGADGFATLANESLSSARNAFSKVEASSNAAFDTLENDPAALQGSISSLQGDLRQAKENYQTARNAVTQIDPGSPVVSVIDNTIAAIDRLSSDLGTISQDISTDASQARAAKAKVKESVDRAQSALDSVQSNYQDTLKKQADKLRSTLNTLGSDTEAIAHELDQTANVLADSSAPLVESMGKVRSSLDATALLLETSALSLDTSKGELERALESKDLAEVRRIIGDDPSALAKVLAAPTQVNKHAVYGVANYGSAMSPFYTSLALFIGSIFLVIILKVNLTPVRRKQLGDPKPYQEYFGNLLFFMLVAFAQALLLCTGNLFFLGVQCESIFLYYLTGFACAFVFLNLIYAFTVAFGDIGKALAVILLVAQVAGSGGELPIQLSAPIFQAIYPWLPFTHSMNLFQGAIAGVYENQYLISFICLMAFAAAALIIGLALRKPIGRLNDYVNEQLEKTGVL